MRIFNADKTQQLQDYDLELGYLIPDEIVTHHEEVEEVTENEIKEFHYDDGTWKGQSTILNVVTPYREAYDEKEEIQVYKLYTTNELILAKIKEYKERLAYTDYQALKYAEGQTSEGDYKSIKTERQSWRDEINKLEDMLVLEEI